MNKKIIYPAILAAALLIIAYIVVNRSGEQSRTIEDNEILLKVDSMQINKFEIKNKFGENIVITKESAGWRLTQPVGYPADKRRIGAALHYCSEIIIRNVVSTNKSKHSVFELDSNSSRVKIYAGGNLRADFYIGKPGQDYSSVFVRKAGSDEVLLVNAPLSYIMDAPAKDWRDKSILSIPQENISEIDFQYQKYGFNLKRQGGIWQIDGLAADSNAVGQLIRALSDFKTDFFLDSALALMPSKFATIKFSGKQMDFYPIESDRYYVKTTDNPQWFIVLKGKALPILMSKSDLIANKRKNQH